MPSTGVLATARSRYGLSPLVKAMTLQPAAVRRSTLFAGEEPSASRRSRTTRCSRPAALANSPSTVGAEATSSSSRVDRSAARTAVAMTSWSSTRPTRRGEIEDDDIGLLVLREGDGTGRKGIGDDTRDPVT